MDYELLVDDQVEDGKSLIKGLIQTDFDVSVAFWARTVEEGRWYFYIGSTSLRASHPSMKFADAYIIIYRIVMGIPNTRITISDIKIIDADDPIARNAIEVRERYAARQPIRYKGKSLGKLAIEEAYIYPRTGVMSRTEVLQTVTGLMDRCGALAPSQVTLRDGTQFPAFPVGIQMMTPGAIQVVFHDLSVDADRSIPVDDVVGIL